MSHPIPLGKQAHYKRAWRRLADRSASLGQEHHTRILHGADPDSHTMTALRYRRFLFTRAEERLASRFQAGRP